MTDYLSQQEIRCRIHQVQKYGKKDSLGIIGVSFGTRADQEVQRQPASDLLERPPDIRNGQTDLSLAEFCRIGTVAIGHPPGM